MQIAPAEDGSFDQKIIERSAVMDRFEGYSSPHGSRIARIADFIAGEFNLAAQDRRLLQIAAYLHDVGEVAMDRDYLNTGHILTSEEHLDMHRHPVIGEQEVARMGLPRGVQLLVRWHHEWWNGSGYPDGLEGEQIPLAARILRAVDTYCALTEDRPFRQAIPDQGARRYLTEWAGIEFDPKVVKKLLEMTAEEQSAGRSSDREIE